MLIESLRICNSPDSRLSNLSNKDQSKSSHNAYLAPGSLLRFSCMCVHFNSHNSYTRWVLLLSPFTDGDIETQRTLDHRHTSGEHQSRIQAQVVSVWTSMKYREESTGEVGSGARKKWPWTALGQRHFPQPHLSLIVVAFYSGQPGTQRSPSSGWLLACSETRRVLLTHRSNNGIPLRERIPCL